MWPRDWLTLSWWSTATNIFNVVSNSVHLEYNMNYNMVQVRTHNVQAVHKVTNRENIILHLIAIITWHATDCWTMNTMPLILLSCILSSMDAGLPWCPQGVHCDSRSLVLDSSWLLADGLGTKIFFHRHGHQPGGERAGAWVWVLRVWMWGWGRGHMSQKCCRYGYTLQLCVLVMCDHAVEFPPCDLVTFKLIPRTFHPVTKAGWEHGLIPRQFLQNSLGSRPGGNVLETGLVTLTNV